MGYSHGVAKGRTRLTHTRTQRTRPLLPCRVGRFESPGSETIRPTCTICAPDPESPQGSLSGAGGALWGPMASGLLPLHRSSLPAVN